MSQIKISVNTFTDEQVLRKLFCDLKQRSDGGEKHSKTYIKKKAPMYSML